MRNIWHKEEPTKYSYKRFFFYKDTYLPVKLSDCFPVAITIFPLKYYPEIFTNLPKVTDKLNHIKVVSSTPRHEWNSNSQI